MAFLDDIDKKLTMLGQGAIQKTREVSDTARISASIRNLENQKKDYLVNLGLIFCSKHREVADEEACRIMGKIDAANEQILSLQEQISRLKGTISCPNCHAEISRNSLFCNHCGTKVQTEINRASEILGNSCAVCGSPMEEGQQFCSNCGNRVNPINVNEQTVAQSENMEKTDTTKEIETQSQICPYCGAEVEEEQSFCIYCGKSL